jgi:triosephosphate isomerase
MRKPIVAGNWKMNKTSAEARELVTMLKPEIEKVKGVETVFCVPFTNLPLVSDLLSKSPIGVGAQNVHWKDNGAFTGEISPLMVKEFADYVIIGHSERRQYFGETDETVNKRLVSSLKHGLTPILCIGETLEENQKGLTDTVLSRQIRIAFENISEEQAQKVVIAYEPVWAIGTGLACEPDTVNQIIIKSIRGPLANLYHKTTAEVIRVQYGGSVNAANAGSYLALSDIDGALVGGASLKLEFIEIVKSAVD